MGRQAAGRIHFLAVHVRTYVCIYIYTHTQDLYVLLVGVAGGEQSCLKDLRENAFLPFVTLQKIFYIFEVFKF